MLIPQCCDSFLLAEVIGEFKAMTCSLGKGAFLRELTVRMYYEAITPNLAFCHLAPIQRNRRHNASSVQTIVHARWETVRQDHAVNATLWVMCSD